jgi:hypothetical protein
MGHPPIAITLGKETVSVICTRSRRRVSSITAEKSRPRALKRGDNGTLTGTTEVVPFPVADLPRFIALQVLIEIMLQVRGFCGACVAPSELVGEIRGQTGHSPNSTVYATNVNCGRWPTLCGFLQRVGIPETKKRENSSYFFLYLGTAFFVG